MRRKKKKKKRWKKIKKNNTNDISDDKSSDKGKSFPTRKKRGISTHKSGHGKTLIRNKNKNDSDNAKINKSKNDSDNANINNDDTSDDNFPVVRNKIKY